MKRTNILWITVLLLGFCFDFLFWKHGQGLNFALYVVLCLAGGFLVMGCNRIRPAWRSLLLLIPILFFAFATLIRQESLSLLLSLALALGLMGLLAITFIGGGWPWYSLPEYFVRFARLVGSLLARPLLFLSERKKSASAPVAAGGTGEIRPALRARPGWKRFWAVFRGVLIALPVVAIFASLLSSADLVFAQRLDDFTKLFRLERLPEYLFRCIYILVGAYALAGVFLHAAQKSQDDGPSGTQKPLVTRFLGFTEAAVVLGAVILLFALFVGIQFRYFFGGQTNIGLQGYTYSEYARRGFGELVAVAFCSLLLFLGLSAIARRQNPLQRWAFSGLGIGMVALVGVMLVSAFQRLLLYEAAYGFTRLRIYTHIFMIWLGVLLVGVVLLELLRRERFFPFAALLATLGFAGTLVLVNVDASIVRQNVRRAAAGQVLDAAYLATLSSDSVPALVQAYQSTTLPSATREAAGAALVCRQAYEGPHRPLAEWQSFTLSNFRARAALEPVQASLEKYQFEGENWPPVVISPAGNQFSCQSNSFDD
jgi:hypothetical protein